MSYAKEELNENFNKSMDKKHLSIEWYPNNYYSHILVLGRVGKKSTKASASYSRNIMLFGTRNVSGNHVMYAP